MNNYLNLIVKLGHIETYKQMQPFTELFISNSCKTCRKFNLSE